MMLIAGCGEADEPPDAERTLHGVVRNAVSHAPVKGVRLNFRSDTLDESSAKTDGDGDYQMFLSTDALNGRIEAKKTGYQARVVSVYFDAESVQVDIELSPN